MKALPKTNYFDQSGLGSSDDEVRTYEEVRNPVDPAIGTLPGSVGGPVFHTGMYKALRLMPRDTAGFSRSFKLLQEWEGEVTDVLGATFTAVIADKTNRDNDNEEVEIELGEIPEEDRPLLRSGALFYWAVGYEDGIGVPRQRVSRIRVKRMPGLTSRDIARAKAVARTLDSLFE